MLTIRLPTKPEAQSQPKFHVSNDSSRINWPSLAPSPHVARALCCKQINSNFSLFALNNNTMLHLHCWSNRISVSCSSAVVTWDWTEFTPICCLITADRVSVYWNVRQSCQLYFSSFFWKCVQIHVPQIDIELLYLTNYAYYLLFPSTKLSSIDWYSLNTFSYCKTSLFAYSSECEPVNRQTMRNQRQSLWKFSKP